MASSVNDALDQPVCDCLEILQDRHYVRTLHQVKTTKMEDLDLRDPMVAIVQENINTHMGIIRARREAKR